MSLPGPQDATCDDVLAAPPHVNAQVIDGELLMTPRPATAHAVACTALATQVHAAFHRPIPGPPGPGGWYILFEPELHLGAHILVPDLAGWRRDRLGVLPNVPYLTQAPDWVCEVLSPSTVPLDRIRKMDLWARFGVEHAWLVDPDVRTLEVYRLVDGLWIRLGAWGGADTVRAEPFQATELELDAWWLQANPG